MLCGQPRTQAQGLSHSRREGSGAGLDHAQDHPHDTEKQTWSGDKDVRTFSFNGSQVLRHGVVRAGFLSTKGHPCTAGKVRQELPAWLYAGGRAEAWGGAALRCPGKCLSHSRTQRTVNPCLSRGIWGWQPAQAFPVLSIQNVSILFLHASLVKGCAGTGGNWGNFLLNSTPLGSYTCLNIP